MTVGPKQFEHRHLRKFVAGLVDSKCEFLARLMGLTWLLNSHTPGIELTVSLAHKQDYPKVAIPNVKLVVIPQHREVLRDLAMLFRFAISISS